MSTLKHGHYNTHYLNTQTFAAKASPPHTSAWSIAAATIVPMTISIHGEIRQSNPARVEHDHLANLNINPYPLHHITLLEPFDSPSQPTPQPLAHTPNLTSSPAIPPGSTPESHP